MQNTHRSAFPLTQRTIFGLLGQTLFGIAYSPEPDVDWPSVFRESELQAVRLQTFADYHTIPDIPPDLREDVKRYVMAAMLKDARVHAQHTLVHDLLTKHAIPYVVLKGVSSALYYPSPLTRAMGDVDFYVSREHLEHARELFEAQGFSVSGLDHICHLTLRRDGIRLEMHFEPAGIPHGDSGQLIREYLSDLIPQSALLQNQTATCYLPAPFHHGLIMLLHLQHHLLAEGIGLRHLCDWAVFVHHLGEEAFETRFRARLKAVGLWKFARLLSLAASLYIGLPEQTWMREEEADEDLAYRLMEDILAGGNFGAKSHQRSYEGNFISNRGKDGIRHNRIHEGFCALNRITYLKCPFTKKCPLLLPVGWVVAFVGYLLRNIRRNRRNEGGRIHIADAFRKSEPRRRLYRSLCLYEPEA